MLTLHKLNQYGSTDPKRQCLLGHWQSLRNWQSLDKAQNQIGAKDHSFWPSMNFIMSCCCRQLPVASAQLSALTISTHQNAYLHCMSDTLHVCVHRGIFQRNLGLRGWWVDWVRDIVLNMHGQDLTALKNAMDDGGDAHNIHKLIYNDILVCAS